MQKKNIPNLITATRGIITVVIGILFYLNFDWKFEVILGLFAIASLSDFIDGFLARRWKVKSVIGKVFDSVLDKVLILTLMMMLIPFKLLPVGVWALFLVRELIVDSLKSYLAANNTPVAPLWSGKFKMVAEVGVVGICLVRLIKDTMWLKLISEVLAGTGLALAYYSAIIYLSKFNFAKNGNTNSG